MYGILVLLNAICTGMSGFLAIHDNSWVWGAGAIIWLVVMVINIVNWRNFG